MPEFYWDTKILENAQDEYKQLLGGQGQKIALLEESEMLYSMDWDERAEVEKLNKSVKITIYPGPRISVDGLIRLLISTEPTFELLNKSQAGKASEQKIENLADMIWRSSGNVGDLIRSAAIYGEFHSSVMLTKDLLAQAEGKDNQGAVERAAYVHQCTPVVFDNFNPKNCIFLKDHLGLTFWHGSQDMSIREIRNRWGDSAKEAIQKYLGQQGHTEWQKLTVHDQWDLNYHNTWIEGEKVPLWQSKTVKGLIPVAADYVEGSFLFDKPELQSAPFLYKYIKSNLWKRQNMMLTAFMTAIYALGLSPAFIEEEGEEGARAKVDWNNFPARIIVPAGNKFEPMANKGLIDPAAQLIWAEAKQLEAETTFYKQALGEPLASDAAYSMVALLAQTGRLPAVPIQNKGGDFIGDLMALAFRLWKSSGASSYKSSEYTDMSFSAKDIPDHIRLKANLEVILPQERLQLMKVIESGISSPDPIASKKWGRDLIGIGQSDDMQEEIWTEKAAETYFGGYLAQIQAKAQQSIQQIMQRNPTPEMQAEQEDQMRQMAAEQQRQLDAARATQEGMLAENAPGAPTPNPPPVITQGYERPDFSISPPPEA